MNNTFLNTFASWPVRCFIIIDNTIYHISELYDAMIDFCEIFQIALSLL
jgi:hypothetical protein